MGGRTANNLFQATTAMFMAAATRSSMLHHDADFNWVELFYSYLFHFALQWCDGKSFLLPV